MKSRSESDRNLAETVSRGSGIPTSPWQIEAWRRAGLLRKASRTFPGHGSQATYSEEAKTEAVELAMLAKMHRRHDHLALVLFARGLYVDQRALRSALAAVIDRAAKWIGPAATEEDLDRIDHKAQKIAKWAVRTKSGRGIRRRLKRSVPEAAAADVYFTLLHLLRKGEATSDEGVGDLLRATGLTGMFEERINGVGPIAPEGDAQVRQFLEQATLENFGRLVRQSPWEDLIAARDLAALLVPVMRDVGFLAMRSGQPNGLGLAILTELDVDDLTIGTWTAFCLLILPHTKTGGAQDLLAQLRSQAGWFRQLVEVAKLVPAECMPALQLGDPTALDRLPTEQRERIREAARAAVASGGGSVLANHTTDEGSLPAIGKSATDPTN